MSALASKQCIPCRGDVPPLGRDQLDPLLAQLNPHWSVQDGVDRNSRDYLFLVRTFPFDNFKQAMAFAVAVGEMAEQEQHHPDLHVAWGRVVVEVWTHKIAGLTESDFVFAAKCDEIDARLHRS